MAEDDVAEAPKSVGDTAERRAIETDKSADGKKV
jgi:hypothetical protein